MKTHNFSDENYNEVVDVQDIQAITLIKKFEDENVVIQFFEINSNQIWNARYIKKGKKELLPTSISSMNNNIEIGKFIMNNKKYIGVIGIDTDEFSAIEAEYNNENYVFKTDNYDCFWIYKEVDSLSDTIFPTSYTIIP